MHTLRSGLGEHHWLPSKGNVITLLIRNSCFIITSHFQMHFSFSSFREKRDNPRECTADMFIIISTHAFGWQPLKEKNCIWWCGAPACKPGLPGSLLTCPSMNESTDKPGNTLALFTGQPEILVTHQSQSG